MESSPPQVSTELHGDSCAVGMLEWLGCFFNSLRLGSSRWDVGLVVYGLGCVRFCLAYFCMTSCHFQSLSCGSKPGMVTGEIVNTTETNKGLKFIGTSETLRDRVIQFSSFHAQSYFIFANLLNAESACLRCSVHL